VYFLKGVLQKFFLISKPKKFLTLFSNPQTPSKIKLRTGLAISPSAKIQKGLF